MVACPFYLCISIDWKKPLSAGLAVAVQETQSQQMMPETAVLEQMMGSLMEWGLVTVR